MILLNTDDLNEIVSVSSKIWAEITAEGEPHRRTWTAKVIWDLRDGKVTGEMTLTNKWLSGLLLQLDRFEENMFIKGTGADDISVEVVVSYPQELSRSVLGTTTRYCSDLGFWLSSEISTS